MARRSECRVQLIGFIANDPTLRYTQEGTPVINLRVMENESWKDASGERRERSHAHDVVFWGDFAEKVVSKLAEKGSYVLIRGPLRYRDIPGQQYEKAGEIKGDEFILLDGPRDKDATAARPAERPTAEIPDF